LSGDNNYVFALWASAFLAGVNFWDADFPAAAFAMKINDGRFVRHYYNTAAFWTFTPLADVFVLHTDFMTTVFAAEPNHKIVSL
jgi:hypothetical protein